MPLVVLVAVLASLAMFSVAVLLQSMALTNPPGYRQPDPQDFSFERTPRTVADLDFEEIAFEAPNGEAIRGWLVPAADHSKRLGVILLHGSAGDRTSMLGQAALLHELGAGVATIDLRENGLSAGTGRGQAIGIREATDAIAATAEMRRHGYDKVILLGCSLGASAAILAAARDPSIDGVIADSALSSFDRYIAEIAERRLARFRISAPWATAAWGNAVIAVTRMRLGLSPFERPVDAIARIAPRPVMLIYGANDSLTSATTHGRALAGAAGAGASLWAAEGAGHCDSAFVAPEEYRARLTSFLAQF